MSDDATGQGNDLGALQSRACEGEYVVDVPAHRVALVQPTEAGANDPPMQEWLSLPVGENCPACGSKRWGTVNPTGYFLVRRCSNCSAGEKFRGPVTPETIRGVVDALCGVTVRFGRGPLPTPTTEPVGASQEVARSGVTSA